MSEFGTLGVIGSGSIAKAIVRGLLDSERVSRDKIMVSGRNLSSLTSLAEKFNVRVTNNNAECILQSDVIVLAVKPQDFAQVVPALRYNIKQTQIILSVMAGISIETIRKTIGIEKILRVMPTIAVSHRQGVLVWTSSSDLSDSEREKTKRLLSLLGKEIYVEDDNMLDLSATISGCGIAYFYFIVDVLIRKGTKLGFAKETSEVLAKQAFIGAAALLKENRRPIERHIAEVASKGGMTEQALQVLRKRGLENIFSEAIDRAAERALELSKSITS